MRCIVIATGHCPSLSPLDERNPAPMLPLGDRPFLQHIVEYLVERGITDFDFVLSHMPEKVEDFLGDGTRWGSRFRFHLARDPIHPYGILKVITAPEPGTTVFLVHADRLPLLEAHPGASSEAPVLYYHRSEGRPQWSGWGRITASALESAPDMDESALEAYLNAQSGIQKAEVPEMLRVQSFEELLGSNRCLLSKRFPGLSLSGTESEEGIWLSRNVSLHPSSTLVPPVYVGQNCRIGTGVRLGPNAVVGHDCVLDTRCTVADSVIFPGSYVGEALELDHVLVDKNRLVNVRVGAAVSITDDFILSGISGGRLGSRLRSLLSRVVAIALLVIACPILLFTALGLALFRSGPVLFKRKAVRLPAPAHGSDWREFELWSFAKESTCTDGLRHLFLAALPGLVNVARGELNFVGVSPRAREEVQSLPHDWQTLYLRAKAGIVTEAFVQYGPNPHEDETYSAEVFYSVSAGVGHDLRLFLRYAARILGLTSGPAEKPADQLSPGAR